MARLKINDVEVDVPESHNVIEAAREANVEIPHFCYHPGLSIAGACRMCLVEIKGAPKLQIACSTMVKDGMEVITNSPKVERAQKGVLEFLLLNHPLDCPICDQAGECPLQDMTFKFGPSNSRFNFEKIHMAKHKVMGEHVIFDAERCILCFRCTRFCEEMAGRQELAVHQRGSTSEIVTFDGKQLQNKFTGNIVDICPVGAFTDLQYRFKSRPWGLKSVDGICTVCNVGCNVTYWTKNNSLVRITPRENFQINDWWMSDKGRYGRSRLTAAERIESPMVNRGDGLRPASWEEALGEIASGLGKIKKANGGKAIAGICGPLLTNEDYYAFQRFMRAALETNHISTVKNDLNPSLDALYRSGYYLESYPSVEGMEAVILLGGDITEIAPIYSLRLSKCAAGKGLKLISAHSAGCDLDRLSSHVLRYRTDGEVPFLKDLLTALGKKLKDRGNIPSDLAGRLKEIPGEKSGASSEGIVSAANLIASKSRIAVIFSEVLASAEGTAALIDLVRLLASADKTVRLFMMLGDGNRQGAADMGISPTYLPGYAKVGGSLAKGLGQTWRGTAPEWRGLGAKEMLSAAASGEIKALYVLGADLLADPALSGLADEALRKVGLLVVHGDHPTDLTSRAHVVLPTTPMGERCGTFTSSDRWVQRFNPIFPPYQGTKADWEIISTAAERMGHALGYHSVENVFEEMAAALPLYRGMKMDKAASAGERWELENLPKE